MTRNKSIEFETAKLEMLPGNIVRLEFKEGILIDHQLNYKIREICAALGIDRVEKLLICAEDFIMTERLFWEYCRKSERFVRGQMIAAVAPTLAQRILARNYLYKYKPENPFRIFDSEPAAILWLTGGEK
ncbi:MAG: hypothetical protein HYZ14_03245 [Bacteroidetes bacterium]|nr:hypothetical protein [Bacteroidota bacterium]